MVRLAVVYDVGAASPLELSLLARAHQPIGVLLGDSAHAAAMAPLFAGLEFVAPASDTAAVERWRPDGIVTFSERMLRRTAVLAETLGLPFHSPRTAALLTDKHLQRAALDAAGLTPVRSRPAGADLAAAIAEIGLPAVVKPRRGEGSRDTHLIEDGRDLPVLPPGEYVLEEYLAGRPEEHFGDYVSVECAAGGGTIRPLAVTGKFRLTPPFREAGQFWPAHLDRTEQDEVAALAVTALRALGVTTGLSHVEIKLTPAGPRIIEVNGRLGGGLAELARRATGLDLIDLAARIALGDVTEWPGPQRPDRVHFQHNSLAPEFGCTVVSVPGGASVRQVPGVRQFRPFVRPGDQLPGGVRTHELDQLTGDADDHAGMLAALTEALGRIVYLLDTPAGRRELTGRELTATCDQPAVR